MKKLLLIGATSAIVQAYARTVAAREPLAVTLVARNSEHLSIVGADLVSRGATVQASHCFDCADEAEILSRAREIWDQHDGFDEVLIGYGMLGEQEEAYKDFQKASEIIRVNYTSVVAWVSTLLPSIEDRMRCTVTAISSVAGERGRAGNYVYGSAKGALSLFFQGLRQQFSGTDIHFLTVLPGFTDTPMTASMDKGPLFSSAERVARSMYAGVRAKKPIIYAPGFWRYIMAVVTHIPERLFVKTSI